MEYLKAGSRSQDFSELNSLISSFPKILKFRSDHTNVAQDCAERADFDMRICMGGNGGSGMLALHNMVTPADADNRKAPLF